MTDLIPTVLFYMFSAVLVGSGLMVIGSRNSVHSVFFLIFAFFNAAGLFLLLGAEYLAMTLVIVYVGAVAVLFLFVVMMLDVDFAQLRQGFLRYMPLGVTVAGLILAELIAVFYFTLYHAPASIAQPNQALPWLAQVTNTKAIGSVLYTDYVFAFEVAGLILLVAMIGAIVLTLRHKPDVRRQRIAGQVSRRRRDAMEIVQVRPGQGA